VKFINRFLFILFAFGLSFISNAQKIEKANELLYFINTLEKEHNVLFSYADDEIDNIIVPRQKKLIKLRRKIFSF